MTLHLETGRFVVVSTGHVSNQTRTILNNTPCKDWPCVGGCYAEYGWFVYAHEENLGEGDLHIPDDLYAVMTWGRQKGFRHVLLDRDGDRIDNLEWHD